MMKALFISVWSSPATGAGGCAGEGGFGEGGFGRGVAGFGGGDGPGGDAGRVVRVRRDTSLSTPWTMFTSAREALPDRAGRIVPCGWMPGIDAATTTTADATTIRCRRGRRTTPCLARYMRRRAYFTGLLIFGPDRARYVGQTSSPAVVRGGGLRRRVRQRGQAASARQRGCAGDVPAMRGSAVRATGQRQEEAGSTPGMAVRCHRPTAGSAPWCDDPTSLPCGQGHAHGST